MHTCIQVLKNSIRGRRDWDCMFCGILDPSAVQVITNVLLQLLRDIINGICCQGNGKRLEQQKDRPNVNICVAEENLEEEP